VSTSRAGTGVASTEGGEAISLNPAGIAKSKGTTITIGAAIINYGMSFQRNGAYDTYDDPMVDTPYEGERYPVIENDPSPPLGIGSYQPVPVIAVTTDLGGRVPGLTLGVGLFAPNAYPFRNMNNVNGNPYFVKQSNGSFGFPTSFEDAPPPTRYDIVEQEAAVILPSIAAAYSITPQIDVGGRFSLGFSEVKSTVALWGVNPNYFEQVQKDGMITLDARDSVVPAWSLGVAYRPAPAIEIGAQYTSQIDMLAKGDAYAANGPNVTLDGTTRIVITPSANVRCQAGGTAEKLKGCVEFALPMTATVGGRYKFLDGSGVMQGDLELNVDWQHWSAARVSGYRVVVDAAAAPVTSPDNGIDLKENIVEHGLKDTFGVRPGGSWNFPAGPNTVTARGGLGYETGAAKEGWERADIDGASRMLFTVGGSYKLSRVSIDLGFGYIYEGTRTDSRNCNPTDTMPGCGSAGMQPVADREGPDPIYPVNFPDNQVENPVNQGTFKSHYLLFMAGMSTWF
jgi:long-subunit fatty acid transport protein